MPFYYHVSDKALRPGTVLHGPPWANEPALAAALLAYQAGAERFRGLVCGWDAIRQWGIQEIYAREAVFEGVRRLRAPSVTSRGAAVYLFLNTQDAERFIQEHRGGQGGIYECFAEDDLEFYRVDMRLWDDAALDLAQPFEDLLRDAEAAAERYFAGTATTEPWWEILSPGPLSVRSLR